MASLVLQLFRMDQHRGITIMWIECVIFLILPIAFFLFVTRWTSRKESSNTQTTTTYLAQGGAVAIALLLIVVQMIDRSVGLGDADELVALLVLQGVGWHLAIFASVRGFERASLLICGAIVFFVCCMSQRLDVLIAGALFAIFIALVAGRPLLVPARLQSHRRKFQSAGYPCFDHWDHGDRDPAVPGNRIACSNFEQPVPACGIHAFLRW